MLDYLENMTIEEVLSNKFVGRVVELQAPIEGTGPRFIVTKSKEIFYGGIKLLKLGTNDNIADLYALGDIVHLRFNMKSQVVSSILSVINKEGIDVAINGLDIPMDDNSICQLPMLELKEELFNLLGVECTIEIKLQCPSGMGMLSIKGIIDEE